MAEVKRSYLVAYDIIDDRRRSHVSKILSTCGERLQYSVFYWKSGRPRFWRCDDG